MDWLFNQRLNKHSFDVLMPDTQEVDRHISQPDHDFDTDTMFTLRNLKEDKETKHKRIKTCENIKKVKTLHPDGLNEYLNRI